MALTRPTDGESSEVQQTDIEPEEIELLGPRGRDRYIWILAGVVFGIAGGAWLLNSSDPPFFVFLFAGAAFACLAMAAGFIRRPRR